MSSQELIESRVYSIHGCVHSWTIHVLNKDWDFDLARVAVKFVGYHTSEEETARPWLTQRRLLQHAARCFNMISDGLVTEDKRSDDEMADAYYNLGRLYNDQGKLVEAEQMLQRALQGHEKTLGPEHTLTLDTVNNLGVLYIRQGKLVEAEQMLQRALQGRQKILGLEHTSTLKAVHNLGALYIRQGKLVEAEQMLQRALQGCEKAWGPQHTSTLQTVHNLGALYARQGKLVEAEQMDQRALQGYEKYFGVDNGTNYPPALDTIELLGSLFQRQGDIVKAGTMYSKALLGRERIFGPDHYRSQCLLARLSTLDIATQSKTQVRVEGPMDKDSSKPRRHRLFRKLGLR